MRDILLVMYQSLTISQSYKKLSGERLISEAVPGTGINLASLTFTCDFNNLYYLAIWAQPPTAIPACLQAPLHEGHTIMTLLTKKARLQQPLKFTFRSCNTEGRDEGGETPFSAQDRSHPHSGSLLSEEEPGPIVHSRLNCSLYLNSASLQRLWPYSSRTFVKLLL